MTIDWSKPVQTREGLPVRVVATDVQDENRPVLVLVRQASGGEFPMQCTRQGYVNHHLPSSTARPEFVNIPERGVVWINVYPRDSKGQWRTTNGYATRQEADEGAHLGQRIACVRVAFTPGQFDEPQEGDE